MGKSILLLDTPKNCVKCRFSIPHDYSFCSEQTTYTCSITGNDTGCRTDGWLDDRIFKADWCPLKPVPEKVDIPDWDDNIKAENDNAFEVGAYMYDRGCMRGYNNCIDIILAE